MQDVLINARLKCVGASKVGIILFPEWSQQENVIKVSRVLTRMAIHSARFKSNISPIHYVITRELMLIMQCWKTRHGHAVVIILWEECITRAHVAMVRNNEDEYQIYQRDKIIATQDVNKPWCFTGSRTWFNIPLGHSGYDCYELYAYLKVEHEWILNNSNFENNACSKSMHDWRIMVLSWPMYLSKA